MKTTFGILLAILSLSVMAEDVKYECSLNAKVDTVKTNIFGGSPKTIKTADFNPCQGTSIPNIVLENGKVSLSECGVFVDGVNFGLNIRTRKISDSKALMTLIQLDHPMKSEDDYNDENVIEEKEIEIGKEVVFEANKLKIDFYKRSRRVKEYVTSLSVLCLKKQK